MTAFLALIRHDLRLALRAGGGAAFSLVFFLMVVTVTPFAIGPDLKLLARIGPAMLWLAAVLATLIGLDRLFHADEADGTLDIWRAGHLPLEAVVLAKVGAHWLATCLPLVLATPLLGLLLALEPRQSAAVALTLLVGTPALTLTGAVGAALTASLPRGGILIAILAMPLMIPTLIFGVSAAQAPFAGTVPFLTPLLLLCATSLTSLVIGVFGAAAALRALGD